LSAKHICASSLPLLSEHKAGKGKEKEKDKENNGGQPCTGAGQRDNSAAAENTFRAMLCALPGLQNA